MPFQIGGQIACNEFDRFVCVNKNGSYKVIALPPEKLFVGKLYDFRKYDASTEFGVIYRETASGKYYGKRTSIGGFILDKEYMICPEKCKLELLTPRSDAVYTLLEMNARGKTTARELNLMELPMRTPKARGILISSRQLAKITHKRYLSEEELEALKLAASDKEETPETDGQMTDEVTDQSVVSAEKPVETAAEHPASEEKKPEESPAESRPDPEITEPETAVPEPVATSPAEEGKKAESAPELASPATEEAVETLVLEDDGLPPARTKRSRPRPKPAAKVEKAPEKPAPDEEDEFGMVQSEFGF